MKKSIMLGVNSKTNQCCQLFCLVPFGSLVSSEIEASDFVHEATNWCGQDDIERTLSFIKMKQTGKKIKLNKKIKNPWSLSLSSLCASRALSQVYLNLAEAQPKISKCPRIYSFTSRSSLPLQNRYCYFRQAKCHVV
jgi:hypothetical protein